MSEDSASRVLGDDPLLNCLLRVAAWHGLEVDPEAVVSGLPRGPDGRLGPEAATRAAERAGFRVRLTERGLEQLPAEILPAIVLLRRNGAGVLLPDGNRDGALRLFVPGEGEGPLLDREGLGAVYLGFVLLLHPAGGPGRSSPTHSLEYAGPEERRAWFWRAFWQFRREYVHLLPASFLVNLFALAMPLFIMIVYDRVVPNHAVETLWVLATGIGLVFAFEFLVRLARGAILEKAGRELDLVLASSLYEQVLGLSLNALPSSAGSLATRVKTYETLREFFASATMLALADLPFALLMIGVIFYLAGPIGWILVVAAAMAIAFGLLLQIPLRRSVNEAAEAGIERHAFLSESLNGLESIKACNAEGHLQQRMEIMLLGSARAGGKSHWYGLMGSSTTTAIHHLTSVATVVASVYLIQGGLLTMGGMIATVMLSSRCLAPLGQVAGLMTRLQQALQALRSLNGVMGLDREVEDGRRYLHRYSQCHQFRLEEVSVQYPQQKTLALQQVTLSVRPGERIALLGRIGSGKSTLLRVLAGLQEPASGQVLLDGIDMRQYHPAGVRRELGYVPQDGTLFHGTLKENLLMGARGITDKALLEAVKFAGLIDFVQRHPDGLHAAVGERGVLLSGGQRQAVLLARCILREPKLLLLDEPTSNMDPQAEKHFIANLAKETGRERTLVVATHKMSILEIVNRILVLDEGRILADGPVPEVLHHLQQNVAAAAP